MTELQRKRARWSATRGLGQTPWLANTVGLRFTPRTAATMRFAALGAAQPPAATHVDQRRGLAPQQLIFARTSGSGTTPQEAQARTGDTSGIALPSTAPPAFTAGTHAPVRAASAEASRRQSETLVLRPESGIPLDGPLRALLERWLGFALGRVRLHTDRRAASLTDRLRAHAFTLGPHIFFAAERFQPTTRRGLALLVHELVHVRQQPDGAPVPWRAWTSSQHRAMEQAAEVQQQAVLAGRPIGASSAALPGAAPGASSPIPPLRIAWNSRPMLATPLRQAASAAPPEFPLATSTSRRAQAVHADSGVIRAAPSALPRLAMPLALRETGNLRPAIARQEIAAGTTESVVTTTTTPGSPPPLPSVEGNRELSVDALVDSVWRRLQRQLAVERERRGWQAWR